MWNSDEFKTYLAEKGKPNAWNDHIYPAMKQVIVQCCQCAQETVYDRKNSFEMYGADFILDEQLNPWLIEVNSSPSLDKSTPATDKTVSSAITDLVKLMVDRKAKKSADVGKWDLAIKQPHYKVALNITPMALEGVHKRAPRKPNCGNFARVPKHARPTTDHGRREKRDTNHLSSMCYCKSLSCSHPCHRSLDWKPTQSLVKRPALPPKQQDTQKVAMPVRSTTYPMPIDGLYDNIANQVANSLLGEPLNSTTHTGPHASIPAPHHVTAHSRPRFQPVPSGGPAPKVGCNCNCNCNCNCAATWLGLHVVYVGLRAHVLG